MIDTSYVTAAVRLVRITAVTFAVALMVGFVAVQSFANHYDSRTVQVVDAQPAADAALASAISTQVSQGLSCREEPALTDTILFQHLDANAVQVMTFEQAIAASSAREGWIRRYCV